MAAPITAAAAAASPAGAPLMQAAIEELRRPAIDCVIMPRSKRGKERFPAGIHITVSTGLLVACPFIFAYLTGRAKELFGGEAQTEDEKAAKSLAKSSWGDVAAAGSPLFAAARAAGLF